MICRESFVSAAWPDSGNRSRISIQKEKMCGSSHSDFSPSINPYCCRAIMVLDNLCVTYVRVRTRLLSIVVLVTQNWFFSFSRIDVCFVNKVDHVANYPNNRPFNAIININYTSQDKLLNFRWYSKHGKLSSYWPVQKI